MFDTPGDTGFTVSTHPSAQVTESTHPLPHFSNTLFLKYELPLAIKTYPSIPYVFTNPHYHNSPTGMVIEGVMPAYPVVEAQFKPLNIIVAVEKPSEEDVVSIHIKKGEVLAYIWIDAEVRLKKTERGSFHPRLKFLGNY